MIDSNGNSAAGPDGENDSTGTEWARQFLDDLVAANRLKTFLAAQGVELDRELVEGLARLSGAFQKPMGRFVIEERERFCARSWWGRLTRGPAR